MANSDNTQLRLQEAHRLFQRGSFAECESVLRTIPSSAKDPKIRHNIAIAQYLSKGGDVRECIEALRSCPSSDSAAAPAPLAAASHTTLSLDYEGHEIAHYNRAVLLAYHGRVDEAASILRGLLAQHANLATSVLCRSLCLFQTITNEAPAGQPMKAMGVAALAGSLVSPQTTAVTASAAPSSKAKTVTAARSKSDDDLVAKMVAQYMTDFKKDPQLSKLFQVTFATDGSALHDVFKSGSSSAERAVYFNDLGVISMGEGKVHTAALYFSKALGFLSSAESDGFTKHSILYNQAICAIHTQDYAAAVSGLLQASESMRISPSLWIRLAQACLGFAVVDTATASHEAYETHQKELAQLLSKGSAFSGFTLLQLPDSNTSLSVGTQLTKSLLMLANQAARTAIQLLCENAAPALAESADKIFSDGRVHDLRQLQFAWIYTAASEMLLENYSVAHRFANDLLTLHKTRPILPDIHATALLYAAECCLRLNKSQQALKLLAAAPLSELLIVGPTVTDGQQKSRTEALFVNLVLVHIANGSWKQAQAIVSALMSKVAASPTSLSSRTAALLQVYLDLAQGNREKVTEGIQRHILYGVPLF